MSQSSDLNYLMRNIQISEQRLYSDKTKKYDLTTSQARALGYIEKHPGANQKEIADHFNLRGSSTSTIIKKLVECGYIEKQPNKGSQDRSNNLYLTATGANLAIDLRNTFADVENLITENLTPEETTDLILLLSKVNKRFIN